MAMKLSLPGDVRSFAFGYYDGIMHLKKLFITAHRGRPISSKCQGSGCRNIKLLADLFGQVFADFGMSRHGGLLSVLRIASNLMLAALPMTVAIPAYQMPQKIAAFHFGKVTSK